MAWAVQLNRVQKPEEGHGYRPEYPIIRDKHHFISPAYQLLAPLNPNNQGVEGKRSA